MLLLSGSCAADSVTVCGAFQFESVKVSDQGLQVMVAELNNTQL